MFNGLVCGQPAHESFRSVGEHLRRPVRLGGEARRVAGREALRKAARRRRRLRRGDHHALVNLHVGAHAGSGLDGELRAQIHDLGAGCFHLEADRVGGDAHDRLTPMQQGAHGIEQLQVAGPFEHHRHPVVQGDFDRASRQGEASRPQRLTDLNASGQARNFGAQGPGDMGEPGRRRNRWLPHPEGHPGQRQQQNGGAGKRPPGPAPHEVRQPMLRSAAVPAGRGRGLGWDERIRGFPPHLAHHGAADLLFEGVGLDERAEVIRMHLEPGRQRVAFRLGEGVIEVGGDPLPGIGHVARLSVCNCCSTQARSCSRMRCRATRTAALVLPRRRAISSELYSSK